MEPKQLTLDIDADDTRHDEESIIKANALTWAKGSIPEAIAWIERAAIRLDEDHARSVLSWQAKRKRHIDSGYPESGFTSPQPHAPRAKHKALANVRAALMQEGA